MGAIVTKLFGSDCPDPEIFKKIIKFYHTGDKRVHETVRGGDGEIFTDGGGEQVDRNVFELLKDYSASLTHETVKDFTA